MLSQANLSREANTVESAVPVLSLLASRFQWQQYHELLLDLLSLVRKSKNPSKGAVRAVCAVIDAFHFNLGQAGVGSTKQHGRSSTEDGLKGSKGKGTIGLGHGGQRGSEGVDDGEVMGDVQESCDVETAGETISAKCCEVGVQHDNQMDTEEVAEDSVGKAFKAVTCLYPFMTLACDMFSGMAAM